MFPRSNTSNILSEWNYNIDLKSVHGSTSIGLVHLVYYTVQIADSWHTQRYNRSTIHSFTLARKQLGFVGSGNVLAVALNAVREAVEYIARVHQHRRMVARFATAI
jgi:hypothetical protein